MSKILSKWDIGLREVADGCYAFIQSGGLNVSNAGFILGKQSNLVIDALYVKPMVESFLNDIRKVSKKPIGQIVFTHHHADHTLGSISFPKNIPLIAHNHMRQRMIETGLDLAHYRHVNPEFARYLKDVKQKIPTHTFSGSMAIYLGEKKVELHHLGHAHSKGDILVYVPSEKVLYTGDCGFNFVTPATFDADIGNWIRVLQYILKNFKVKKVVPGHGPVGNKRVLEDVLNYLKLVRREAKKRFKSGMTARQAAKDIPLKEYKNWMKPDRVEQAVMKLYNEFRGKTEQVISLNAARGG